MKHITERSRSNIPLDMLTREEPAILQGGAPLNSFHVNGQWLPTINMKPGETSRFRVINAAAAESISLVIEGEFPFKYEEDDLKAEQENRLNGLHCDMTILAMDGVYLKEPWKVPSVHLVPGARADLAIHCPKSAGTGRLILGSALTYDTQTHIGGTSHIHNGPMAYIEVSGIPLNIDMPLPTVLPQRGYIENLEAMKNSAPSGDDWTIKWGRHTPNDTRQWAINDDPYEHGDIKAELSLGHISKWQIYGDDYHPFHLHTNHFQIDKVPVDDEKAMQMLSLKPGMYRDTVPSKKERDEKLTISIIPVDYAGVSMTHCHVASHSDQGMLADILIKDDEGVAKVETSEVTYVTADYAFSYNTNTAPATPPQPRKLDDSTISTADNDSNNGATANAFGITTFVVAALVAQMF
jgi:FtsP/CotA-like multicopper oxidase with cupredoxin domain